MNRDKKLAHIGICVLFKHYRAQDGFLYVGGARRELSDGVGHLRGMFRLCSVVASFVHDEVNVP